MRKKIGSIFVLGLPYFFTVLLPVLAILCLGSVVTNTYQNRIIVRSDKGWQNHTECRKNTS